ncbi:retroviral-like aspartic protease family protein [Candidatus Bathyarchaeota archaeon]|nr:retroviral-like aspartic protease family protein [Candidatus Bathyarchaeota archaeon]
MKITAVEDDEEEQLSLDAVIANPADPKRRSGIKFVVDTGASMTAITDEVAKRLRLKYVATAEVGLADGKVIKVDMAYVYLHIHGEHVFTLVCCGGCDVPLLGFDILSLLQLQIDVANKKVLRPVRRRFKILRIVWKRVWGSGGLGKADID